MRLRIDWARLRKSLNPIYRLSRRVRDEVIEEVREQIEAEVQSALQQRWAPLVRMMRSEMQLEAADFDPFPAGLSPGD
ncbi:MAG TPA: hypothetical protein VD932_03200 [Aquabacterium sp.]|nr:hypothetical protein [Aquabacterium sp.]